MYSYYYPGSDYPYGYSAFNRFGRVLPDKPVRTVAPAPLLTIDEACAACNVKPNGEDDQLILTLAAGVVSRLDGYYGVLGGRTLVTQTWVIKPESWLMDGIFLPLTPIQSITSVKYYDANNVLQTWGAANYYLTPDGEGYRVGYVPLASPPALYQRFDALEITFVAGYGPPASVPGAIKAAVMLKLRLLYAEIKRNPTVMRETAFGVGMQMFTTAGQNESSINTQIEELLEPFRCGGGIS